MLAIVDFGSGNTGSILNMVRKVGGEAIVTSSEQDIRSASGIILPGVGAFDAVAHNLQKSGLQPLLAECALSLHVPFLAICVGMQLLFDTSEEGSLAGLGWIPGKVKRFDLSDMTDGARLRVPHMGWNIVNPRSNSALFHDLEMNARFYFVHSYHAECAAEYQLASTDYGYPFTCAVQRDNIYGVQFHPEKSHRFGMQLFQNFIGRVCSPSA